MPAGRPSPRRRRHPPAAPPLPARILMSAPALRQGPAALRATACVTGAAHREQADDSGSTVGRRPCAGRKRAGKSRRVARDDAIPAGQARSGWKSQGQMDGASSGALCLPPRPPTPPPPQTLCRFFESYDEGMLGIPALGHEEPFPRLAHASTLQSGPAA